MSVIRRISACLISVVALHAAAQSNASSVATGSANQQKRIWEDAIAAQKAWTVSDILADKSAAVVDTLMENYSQSVAIPHLQFGTAAAITGNLGGAGQYMNYFERPEKSDFFFNDAYHPYLPRVGNTPFFNTRVPMTLISFNTGGSSETTQDWLRVRFNGNINKRAQVGAWLSYLYSRGMYDQQSGKHFNWGFNGSYLGEKYQVMAMFNNWNVRNFENGGITDDLYITDPASVQGGSSHIGTKQIPVNLEAAQAHLAGHQLWMTNRYRMGIERWNEVDSVMEFIPASQLFWTFDFRMDSHRYTDAYNNDNDFYRNTYFTNTTEEKVGQWYIRNAVGIELLEGFKPWVKFGLAAYAQHEIARYQQNEGYFSDGSLTQGISPRSTENSIFIGGRLNKTAGALLRYTADAKLGLAGAKAGEVYARGNIDFRFKLMNDTAIVRGYVDFSNRKPSYFLREYISNHYIWNNDFGKTRKLRFGGLLDFPLTATTISAGLENVQNLVYFNSDGTPSQSGENVQIFSASLDQRLHFGIYNWDNKITYQKSSNQHVVPLPELTIYSNMYLLFRVATLRAQIGVDCTYMTRYSALGYNPAVSSFTNCWQELVGNYPMMDVYANLKLKKVKFYVLYSHFNQGLFGGSNYFSALHYPLNPHRFLFGLCVDFAN